MIDEKNIVEDEFTDEITEDTQIEGQMTLEEVSEEENLPKLSEEEKKSAIEAILFTMGKSVELISLADALMISKKEVQELLNQMQQDYENNHRGIQLIYMEDKVQLSTKKEFYPYLIRIASRPKKQVLTEVMLETLSIIAYKQPVTKIDIERIRGVKSDFGVNKLLEYGLIEEVGRLEAPGRPVLFATSEEFLRRFGMQNVENLPNVDDDVLDSIKEEAESEIDVTV